VQQARDLVVGIAEQRWVLDAAAVKSQRAARREPAAVGKLEWARRLAGQRALAGALRGVDRWRGGDQRSGVGMAWISKYLLRRWTTRTIHSDASTARRELKLLSGGTRSPFELVGWLARYSSRWKESRDGVMPL
jgi:hypothetical protein